MQMDGGRKIGEALSRGMAEEAKRKGIEQAAYSRLVEDLPEIKSMISKMAEDMAAIRKLLEEEKS